LLVYDPELGRCVYEEDICEDVEDMLEDTDEVGVEPLGDGAGRRMEQANGQVERRLAAEPFSYSDKPNPALTDFMVSRNKIL
jgi:hypothetical protein